MVGCYSQTRSVCAELQGADGHDDELNYILFLVLAEYEVGIDNWHKSSERNANHWDVEIQRGRPNWGRKE